MTEEVKKQQEETPATKEKADSTTETVKVPAQFKELVSKIEEMSVLELSELVKVLEEKFGVSAAAPVVLAGPADGGGEEGGDKEISAMVNVELTEGGSSKISVIKALREVTELGLKEAKDLVEGAPQMVQEGVKREEAEEMKKKLEEAGAKVTFK